jgi:predicted DNA-binding protein
MARGDDQVRIRLDADAALTPFRLAGELHTRLKIAADRNSRSMNAEIVARLEASFGVSSLDAEIASAIRQHVETEVQARLRAVAAKLGETS